MQIPFEQIAKVLINEYFLYRNYVVGTFIFFVILGIGVGSFWPKMYTASTTILVDSTNIIQPLMRGAAVTTEVVNRAQIAREIIHGRKIMNQIADYSEWLDDNPDELLIVLTKSALETSSDNAKAGEIQTAMTEEAEGKSQETQMAMTEEAENKSQETTTDQPEEEKTLGQKTDAAMTQLIKRERQIETIQGKTVIVQAGRNRNVISIAYSDRDSVRAYKITKKIANLFIAQSLEVKIAESRAAYGFISKQVGEYHEKLINAEEQLKNFRIENLETRPGSEGQIDTRLNNFRNNIERTEQELREAQIRYATLTAQLSGEAEATTAFTREGQYRQRVAELQTQLDTLRLSYHESYPDIIRIKNQIVKIKKAIEGERVKRVARKRASGNKILIDEGVLANPLYQQLRTDLSQTRTMVVTLEARLEDTRAQLAAELERAKKVHGGEATLAELTRDYTVNRDIYQDLLRRRENARVSMNLDQEQQGLTLKIQEPATLPVLPSGPRFLHFILGGVLLGLFIPLGLLYAIQVIDPRIRYEVILKEKLRLPVMAKIPHLALPSESLAIQSNLQYLGVMIAASLIVVVTAGVFKMAGFF